MYKYCWECPYNVQRELFDIDGMSEHVEECHKIEPHPTIATIWGYPIKPDWCPIDIGIVEQKVRTITDVVGNK